MLSAKHIGNERLARYGSVANLKLRHYQNFAGGRGNVTLGVSYDNVDGVLSTERPFNRAVYLTTNNPTAAQAAILGPAGRTIVNDGRVFPVDYNGTPTDGIPGSVLIANRRIFTLSRGGVIFSGPLNTINTNLTLPNSTGLQFDPNGNLVPFVRGVRFNTGAGTIDASGGDGLNLSEFGQLTSSLERFSAMFNGRYELSDGLSLFAEGLYYRANAKELANQPIFNGYPFGGASATLNFSVNDPRLTPQARSTLLANGYTNTFVLSRASADIVTPRPTARTDLYRAVLGLNGNFGFFGRSFNFEAYGSYGRSDATFRDTALNQQKFVNAINNCNATPTVNATPGFTPVADAACVPLNLFGEGRSSAAALAYVTAATVAKSRLEQYVFNANAGGTLFDIWGGGVALNVGYEHREERAAFTPDAFLQAGLGRSVAILPVSGKFNVDEAFGEVVVPLVSRSTGLSFINTLELVGRVRYVDNSVNGGFTAFTGGGRFAPISDIEFRGNFTRSFRAPAVTELFSPRTNIFTFVNDLCSPTNINGGPAPATRLKNCTAFLGKFPGATPLAAAAASVPGVNGGNAALQNEKADSFTYGVVLKPSFLRGFSASVDYINIKIKNPISNLNATTIVSGCFDNADFNTADPANGNAFCSQIRRDANGQVDSTPANPGVITGFVNGKIIRFDGIQGRLDWSIKGVDLGLPGGEFGISASGLYVRNRVNDITGVAPVRIDGSVGDPKFAAQLNLSYDESEWGTYWSLNYTGREIPSRTATADTNQFLSYPGYFIVNPSVYVRFNKTGRFILSVTNLFDKQEIFPLQVDALGRRYAVTFQHRF